MAINEEIHPEETTREPVLSPVDRVSEMLFGLFMALTFVGAVSVAESGDAQIREMFIAALGCNLAWGLVDAVMYLVRTVTDRGRLLTLVRSVREPRTRKQAAAHRALAVTGRGGPRLAGGGRGNARADRRADRSCRRDRRSLATT